MQKKLVEMFFGELEANKDRLRVATDDYSIYAIDEAGVVYKVTDMKAYEVSSRIWDFLGIDVKYLDEKVLDRAYTLEDI